MQHPEGPPAPAPPPPPPPEMSTEARLSEARLAVTRPSMQQVSLPAGRLQPPGWLHCTVRDSAWHACACARVCVCSGVWCRGQIRARVMQDGRIPPHKKQQELMKMLRQYRYVGADALHEEEAGASCNGRQQQHRHIVLLAQ